jgi:hypothetical protein
MYFFKIIIYSFTINWISLYHIRHPTNLCTWTGVVTNADSHALILAATSYLQQLKTYR